MNLGCLQFEDLLRLLLGEIADANASNLALFHQRLQRLPRLLDRHINNMNTPISGVNREPLRVLLRLPERHGPVDQIQIQVIGAEILQRLINSLLDISASVVRVPELGSQEKLLARHAGCLDAGSDLSLVVVDSCSVDVAVSMLQGKLDSICDLIRTRLLPNISIIPSQIGTGFVTQVPSPTAGMVYPEFSLKERPEDMMKVR